MDGSFDKHAHEAGFVGDAVGWFEGLVGGRRFSPPQEHGAKWDAVGAGAMGMPNYSCSLSPLCNKPSFTISAEGKCGKILTCPWGPYPKYMAPGVQDARV